jgi:hypothetical protein
MGPCNGNARRSYFGGRFHCVLALPSKDRGFGIAVASGLHDFMHRHEITGLHKPIEFE